MSDAGNITTNSSKNISLNTVIEVKLPNLYDENADNSNECINEKHKLVSESEQLSLFEKITAPAAPAYPTDIPMHTDASPTKLCVQITDVGHAENQGTNAYGRVNTVFVPGADASGAVSAKISVKCLRGKTVKSALVYVTPLNRNGGAEICSVTGESTRCVAFSGPVPAGQTICGTFDKAWYNVNITDAKIAFVVAEYIDGKKEVYTEEDVKLKQQTPMPGMGFNAAGASPYAQSSLGFTPATQRSPQAPVQTAPVQQTRPAGAPAGGPSTPPGFVNLFIHRNPEGLVTNTTKLNRLTCVLSTGERVEVGFDQTVCIPVKPGVYSIKFEFWGGSLVPAKNKKTPEFTVTGNTCVNLTHDVMWGGFTTEIFQT